MIFHKNTPLSSKGIILNQDFQVSDRRPSGISMFLMMVSQAVIILLGLIGAGYSFITMFKIPHSMPVLLIFLLACTIIWMLVFSRKKAQIFLIPILLSLPVPLAFLFWQEIKNGFIVTANYIVYAVNRQMNLNIVDYVVHCHSADYSYVATLFFLFISFYLSFLLCWAVGKRHSFLIVILSTLPLLFGLLITLIPSYLAILMLITCWMSMFAMYPLKARRRKQEKTKAFTASKQCAGSSYVLSDPKRINPMMVKTGAIIIFSTLICIGLLLLCFPKDHYKRSDRISQLQYNLLQGLHNMNGSIIQVGGLSDGDLNKLGNLSFRHVPTLKIGTNYGGPMYLRGWVGSEYSNSKWINSEATANEFRQKVAFNTFEIPQYQISEFTNIYRHDLYGQYSLWPGEIEYINATKDYFYTPYSIQDLNVYGYYMNSYLDLDLRPIAGFSDNSYTFHFFTPQENQFYISFNTKDEGSYGYFDDLRDDTENKSLYKQQESAYRSYVYWEYTYLSEETREFAQRFLQDHNLPNATVPQEYNALIIQNAVSQVTDFLKQNYVYTLSPGSTPEGMDFVEYFLTESKRGYCTHYASSAVILLRAMGIPSRYVEGYVVTESDIQSASSGTYDYEYTIEDTNAHAWVEVYQNGVGWIPFETTPGYSGLNQINLTGENGEWIEGAVPSKSPSSYPLPVSSFSSSSEQSSSPVSGSSASPSSLSDVPESSTADHAQLKLFLVITAMLLFTIGVTVAIILIRRRLTLHGRERRFHSNDINRNAYQIFQYFQSVMDYEGLSNRGISLLKYAKQVSQKYVFIDEDEMTSLAYLVLKTRYSDETISTEELEHISQFTSRTISLIYQSHSFWERLIFKYIHNLC